MTATTLKLTVVTAAVLCAASGGCCGPAAPSSATSPPAPSSAASPKPAAPGERLADAKQRLMSQNNLKQILLGFHQYHDKYNYLPRDIASRGKPLLSWRVAILPFIGQEELYKQFKLDEPWDSEHNKTLLAKMPAAYRIGFEPRGETKTYYQGFSGPGALFGPEKFVHIARDLPGGSANTFAVVEAGPPVEWTRPADIAYDPKKPLPKLELPFPNVLMAATADGDARPYRPDLDEASLRRLIEGNDGPLPSPDALRPPLLPFTRDDEEFCRMLLKENETLIRGIVEQLAEQRKLLDELAKKRNPDNPAAGFDLSQLEQKNKELERELEALKHKTKVLRNEVEAAGKK